MYTEIKKDQFLSISRLYTNSSSHIKLNMCERHEYVHMLCWWLFSLEVIVSIFVQGSASRLPLSEINICEMGATCCNDTMQTSELALHYMHKGLLIIHQDIICMQCSSFFRDA